MSHDIPPQTYALIGSIDADYKDELQSNIDNFKGLYADIVSTLETLYGTHNWGSTPDERILTLGAYNTNNVDPQNILDLLILWKECLKNIIQHNGVISDPVKITSFQTPPKDYEIYREACEIQNIPPLV
jgi:hypothetical protein